MRFILQMLQAFILGILFFSASAMLDKTYAQKKLVSESSKDSLIVAAREIMKAAGYCALITVDSSGQPQARVMDAFLPEDDMVVWLATNPKSRKVKQLRRDSRSYALLF